MIRRRARGILLVIIALELAGSALVLWWLFGPQGEQAPDGSGTGPLLEKRPLAEPATVATHEPQQPPEPVAGTMGESPARHETATPEAVELQPVSIWLARDLPAPLREPLQAWVAEQPTERTWAQSPDANVTVDWEKRLGARLLAEVVLVPVVPFSSLQEDIEAEQLRRLWLGEPGPRDMLAHLLVAPETAAALDILLGPHSTQAAVTIVPAAELATGLWAEPGALAIVPFDRLEPQLRALSVDGLSVLEPELDLRDYPLVASVWVKGSRDLTQALTAEIDERELAINRHPDHMTVLMMTGVTALTRGVAWQIEQHGDYAWPAWPLAELLSSADLTHISNEVSFKTGCVAQLETSTFCARPEYLETLRLVGADLIELTGNHNIDFGRQPALQSLDLYAEVGMHTFGGGRNLEEACCPLVITHNGNRLAFLGYNQFGPEYAWATAERPGAARFSREGLQADLAQVRPKADVVFVNIQHTETYTPFPLPDQVTHFRWAVDAGADVVTGSQAHQPQAIEFYDGRPIFYGLGNLFFDQTWSDPTRQGLIVRHVIHDGQLIASQPIPVAISAQFQTYPARGEEKEAILQMVFDASGW